MRQAPRGKTDSLVSRFTLLRYAVTGTYVGLATVGAFVHFYARRGVPLPLLRQWTMCSEWVGGEGGAGLLGYATACEAFDPAKGKLGASACALTTLVVMEMLRATCAVSETASLLVSEAPSPYPCPYPYPYPCPYPYPYPYPYPLPLTPDPNPNPNPIPHS